MLRHAAWLLNRFQLQSDNKTSFHRRWGAAYNNSVLPFGELILAEGQTLAIWLGRCDASDQHIVATANSQQLGQVPISHEAELSEILWTLACSTPLAYHHQS